MLKRWTFGEELTRDKFFKFNIIVNLPSKYFGGHFINIKLFKISQKTLLIITLIFYTLNMILTKLKLNKKNFA